jgi:hypothetical protein
MYKKILVFLLAILPFLGFSKEGMWLPFLVEQLAIDDMRSMGFKLSPEDIYSVNQSSLKDAVVHFGGGCTGEIISEQGLLLTNHHCGYGQIQYHSTVENDFLTNGFWAMSQDEELPNPGLTATFIISMKDVTELIFDEIQDFDVEEQRAKIKENIEKVGKEATEGTHYEYVIKPFYNGNHYYMFITETFKDVRLVGAPPSSIGKFGFDTDNWVWPRHTGDFSIFRIYADKDNKPAEYSKDNVPFKPKYSFPISLNEVKEGDFTLLYGFPGRTQEYLTSYAVDYTLNSGNPAKITMRDASLEIINRAMAESDKVRIQYAAKQSRISNSHKKWIGESKGLKRLDAIKTKQLFEEKFAEVVAQKPETQKLYGDLLIQYNKLYQDNNKFVLGRDLFIELYYYGPEIFRFANDFNKYVDTYLDDEITEELKLKSSEVLKPRINSFFKDYNAEVDQQLFAELTRLYVQLIDPTLMPKFKALVDEKYKGDYEAFAEKTFKKSIFDNRVDLSDFVYNPSKSKAKKLSKDPIFVLVNELLTQYRDLIAPAYTAFSDNLDMLEKDYLKAMMELMPDEKRYYPDANSTLRVAYGKVEGYEPKDGAYYHFYTTLDGVAEKYIPGDREYDVPEKLMQLYFSKDYGQYGYGDKMPVCFIASNHSTGGNSGSPVLDADGNLKGLNFDRCWEGTMSDIMFDPDRCRNIMVDLNYVLFIIDKFADAKHLIDEMKLVKSN